ncbi:MAG TPA: hypothetical protein VKP30_27295, partial [Polyangiaceae bacterium]|nr:hypothetical protein [Polyangiaceae bacterium]
MTTSRILLACTSFVAVIGCSAESTVSQEAEDVATNESSISAGNATLTMTSNSPTDYCARVAITNGLTAATARWQVVLDVKGANITSSSNVNLSGNSG